MTTVRYGAKTVQRNREIEATTNPIWVNAVQAVTPITSNRRRLRPAGPMIYCGA